MVLFYTVSLDNLHAEEVYYIYQKTVENFMYVHKKLC